MYMFKYVMKRLSLMLFTFIIIFTMCFVLIKLLPIPTNALPGQDPRRSYGDPVRDRQRRICKTYPRSH